jgi:hypothetical protein
MRSDGVTFFPKENDMKFAALITVAALTCGTALAQGYGSSSSNDRSTSASPSHSSAMANDDQAKGEGFMDKTKRAFHRLGEKLRGAGHTAKNSADKDTDKTAEQKQNDTRAMGASGSDSSRTSRMDQAYADSKKSKSADTK